MSKKDLKKEKESLVSKLLNDSKNPKKTNEILDKLFSLDRQLNIKPTEVLINHDADAKVINYGAFTFTKTDGVIVYSFNGLRTISYAHTPWYSYLKYLFDLKDLIDNDDLKKYDIKKEDAEKQLDDALFLSSTILQIPSLAFQSEVLKKALIDILFHYVDIVGKHNEINHTAGDDESDITELKEMDAFIENTKKEMKLTK